jgi:adhesin transport system outer membrane protein
MDPLKEHVSYSKEAKILYHEQYNVDRRSLIDLLNSQVEAFNAQKALTSAQYDEIAAKYRILNSMGALNETLGLTPKVSLVDN